MVALHGRGEADQLGAYLSSTMEEGAVVAEHIVSSHSASLQRISSILGRKIPMIS